MDYQTIIENGCDNGVLEQADIFTHEELKFRIKIPKTYQITVDNQTLPLIATNTAGDVSYMESLGVDAFFNSSQLRLDEIFDNVMNTEVEDLKADLNIYEFNLWGKGEAIIGKYDSRWVLYSYIDQNNTPLALLNIFLLSDEHAYKFVFGSKPSDMDSLACKYSNIINTLELLN